MPFEECAGVHTRPRQVLSHAHMCAGGKCDVQCETQIGLTKLRKMCERQGVLSTCTSNQTETSVVPNSNRSDASIAQHSNLISAKHSLIFVWKAGGHSPHPAPLRHTIPHVR